jgi:dTDP-glucose 4,6-dehydratase
MKILITGGCGFIGSHVVEHFLKNTKWEIVIFDKLTYAASGFDRVRDIKAFDDKRVTFFTTDITRSIPHGVIQETKDTDYILHLAAESVSEDTIIPTYKGGRIVEHIKIKDLWERLAKKYMIEGDHIEVINIDDKQEKALSIKNNIGQWKEIKQISRHWYEGKIINMRQKWGEIFVTPNHSIYNSNMELVMPSPNEELLSIRTIKPFRNQISSIDKFGKYNWTLSLDDYLYMIAFFVTEGWISFNIANGSYNIGFSQKNNKDIDKIRDIFKLVFNKKGYESKDEKDCYQIIFNDKYLFHLFKNLCGEDSKTRIFSPNIFKLNDKHKEKFWDYMVYFDGHRYNTHESDRYTTTSPLLTSQLCTLLSMLNKNYSYEKRVFDKEEWSDSYILTTNYIYNCNINKQYYSEIDYEGYVYDLEIDDTNKFVCGLGNVIVHNTHVDNSIDDPEPFVMSNVVGTMHMLEYAKKLDDLRGFNYFSTDEVFGPAPKDINYHEWDRYNSTNPYAATKAGGEELVLAYANTYRIPVFITHGMNCFGERQHPEKFIPKVIRKVLNGDVVTIHSDATKTIPGSRFYIHCRNVAHALHFLLDKFQFREKYNIVGEKEVTNLELALLIAEILEKPLNYELVDFHSSRPGHDLRYALDGSRMEKMGWHLPVDFEKSLERTVKWYFKFKANKKWLYL